MKYLLLTAFLFSCVIVHAQNTSIKRDDLVGRWNAYDIMDTAAYFSIADSMKKSTTVPKDPMCYKIIDFNSDSTYSYSYSRMIDGTIAGTWDLRSDTLCVADTVSCGKTRAYMETVRYISPGRIEIRWAGYDALRHWNVEYELAEKVK